MSLTFGFYNSINKDRGYDATHMSKIFDGIINDGIFMSVGTALRVNATTGMNITIGLGRAWFNHTWTNNDSILPLTIDPSEIILHRIDLVVLEVNANDVVRANSIKIIKGTPSSFPIAPVCIRTELVNQYPLAEVYVAAGTSSISQLNITNKVGTSTAPFVTGILSTINIDMLVVQWQSEFDVWMVSLDATLDSKISEFDVWFAGLADILSGYDSEFHTWFVGIQNILSGDVAGNLLVKIDSKPHVYKGAIAPVTPTNIDFWFKQV